VRDYAGGQARPGAWVAEVTSLLDLESWPEGMRVIVRKERPHPGAQLRFTDLGGHWFTAFATNARTGSSLTWNCATAAGPAMRTGSAARGTAPHYGGPPSPGRQPPRPGAR
jgi:hypothetical protein